MVADNGPDGGAIVTIRLPLHLVGRLSLNLWTPPSDPGRRTGMLGHVAGNEARVYGSSCSARPTRRRASCACGSRCC